MEPALGWARKIPEGNPRPSCALRVVLATDAPVGVIIRRGPSHWSRLVLWRTDRDEFTPGQWLRGVVKEVSLSSKGTHLAAAIMGKRTRDPALQDRQYGLVCRPPYFTALALCFAPLCWSTVYFEPSDQLVWLNHGEELEFRAPFERCPFPMLHEYSHSPRLRLVQAVKPLLDQEITESGMDQGSRPFRLMDGQVWRPAEDPLAPWQSIADFRLDRPQEVLTPEWAKDW